MREQQQRMLEQQAAQQEALVRIVEQRQEMQKYQEDINSILQSVRSCIAFLYTVFQA